MLLLFAHLRPTLSLSPQQNNAISCLPEVGAAGTQDQLVHMKFSVVHSNHCITELLLQTELIVH